MRAACLLVTGLLACGCPREVAPPTVAPRAVAPPATLASPDAQPTRDVLVYHCGRCHRSDLPTALPGALAVFDLTDDHWDRGLSSEQLDGLLRRIRGSDEVDPRDVATVEAFVVSARGERPNSN